MKRIVDAYLRVSLGATGIHRIHDLIALALDGVVDEGGQPAARARLGAVLKVVGTHRAAKRKLQMNVYVDASRHDVLSSRINDLFTSPQLDVRGDLDDLSVRDPDVGFKYVGGGDNGPIPDYGIHSIPPFP